MIARGRYWGGSACLALGIAAILCGCPAVFGSGTVAQTYYFGRLDIPTGYGSQVVATADFNADGITDLAVVNSYSNTVSILLGKPDGTFQAPVSYPVGSEPQSIVVADFNGDGKADLAIGNRSSNTVSILLGNGDGTFQPAVDYPTTEGPQSIAVGDFNGDGKLDLAVLGSGGAGATICYPDQCSYSILLGNGDGTFQSHVDYPTVMSPSAIQAADLTGNGKLDLVIADSGYDDVSQVCVYLGRGDGTFGLATCYPTGQTPVAVAISDVNSDGVPDLITANAGDNTVSILLGNGDGTFHPPTDYAVGTSPESLTISDLNGDGKPDIVTTNQISDDVSVLLGKGDGTFKPYATYGAGDFPTSAIVADFNGDGRQDLAVANSIGGSVTILLGKGDGTFFSASSLAADAAPNSVATGDFAGDGKQDIAVVNSSSNTVSVYLRNGDGTFQPKVDYATGEAPSQVIVGDFNGDGKPDLAVAYANSPGFGCPTGASAGGVFILLGNGDGTFQPHQDYSVGEYLFPRSVAVADYNGDGKLDLAVLDYTQSAPYADGALSILLGKGDGTFGSPVSSVASCNLLECSLVSGDFNRDGKADLAGVGGANLWVWLGNGNGTFQPPVVYSYSTNEVSGTSLVIGDFNRDGNIDLAVAGNSFGCAVNCASGKVSILLGNGDGSFGPDINLESGSAVSVAAADFNGDGALDLAAANSTGTVSVFLSAPVVALSPNPLNFGNQLIKTASPPLTVSLSNPGVVALNLSKLNLTGESFSSENNTCPLGSTLAVASACTVGLIFTPTATGSLTGTLSFVDDSQGLVNNTQTVVLKGTGAVPIVSVPTANLTFAPQRYGSASAAQTVTLTNSGNWELSISGVIFSGADQGDFAQSNTCGAALAAGANCTIMVTFTPQGLGTRAAMLAIDDNNNGVNNGAQTIALSGTGAVAAPSITWATPTPIVYGTAITAAQLDATSPVQGTFAYNPPAGTALTAGTHTLAVTLTPANMTDYTTATQSVQLSVAQAPLVVTATSVSRNYGSANPPLTGTITGLVNNDPISATSTTTATPASPPGTYPITPTLSDPDGRLPNYALTIKNGTLTVVSAPLVGLSPGSLNFGSEIVGGTASPQNVTLENTGTAALAVTNIAANGNFTASSNCGSRIAAGAKCSIAVGFKPTAGGNLSGALTITDSAAGSPQSVALEGSGEDFSFTVPAGSSTSATVSPGGTATYTLSVGGTGGLTPPIAFSCAGAPSASTCAVAPASVTPGPTPAPMTVTVTTTASSALLPPPGAARRGGRWRLLIFAIIGLLVVALARILQERQAIGLGELRCRLVKLTVVLLLSALITAACGGMGGSAGGGGNPGTPLGEYTLTVTGRVTSGSTTLAHEMNLKLNVQ